MFLKLYIYNLMQLQSISSRHFLKSNCIVVFLVSFHISQQALTSPSQSPQREYLKEQQQQQQQQQLFRFSFSKVTFYHQRENPPPPKNSTVALDAKPAYKEGEKEAALLLLLLQLPLHPLYSKIQK